MSWNGKPPILSYDLDVFAQPFPFTIGEHSLTNVLEARAFVDIRGDLGIRIIGLVSDGGLVPARSSVNVDCSGPLPDWLQRIVGDAKQRLFLETGGAS